MPQLDVFIFINSGVYLFIGFFLILAYNHLYILPSLGSLLKLRKKMVGQKMTSDLSKLPEIKTLSIENYFNK